jgi:hypothetical protein
MNRIVIGDWEFVPNPEKEGAYFLFKKGEPFNFTNHLQEQMSAGEIKK